MPVKKKKREINLTPDEKGIPAPEPIDFKAKVVEQKEGVHEKTIENLIMNCRLVKYTVSWFSKSKKVSKNAKSRMVMTVNGKDEGYSASKRLLASSHDAMKLLNQAKADLETCRNAYTVVKVTKSEEEHTQLEGGVRLICVKDIEEFDRKFQFCVEELMKRAADVQAALPEIKALDKQRLGTEYDEEDYPEDIRTQISVNGPFYSKFTVDTKLPETIYKRQEEWLREEINGSVVGAATYVSDQLINAFDDLARQLISRQVVFPTDPVYEHLRGGELLVTLRNRNDPSIQEGYVKCEIRMEEENKKIIHTIGPMLESKFNDIFVPTPTSSNRKLYDSTFDKVLDWLENFNRVKGTIGEYGEQMDKGLTELRTKISEISRYAHGKSTSAMTETIKENSVTRQQLAETLNEAVASLQATTASVQQTAKRKLNFNVKLD